EEALMIEPTETESKETLDQFCEAMITIAREAETNPQAVLDAPRTTPVRRLDQTKAAREPNLRWRPRGENEGSPGSKGPPVGGARKRASTAQRRRLRHPGIAIRMDITTRSCSSVGTLTRAACSTRPARWRRSHGSPARTGWPRPPPAPGDEAATRAWST